LPIMKPKNSFTETTLESAAPLDMPVVSVYTDGACIGNPGPGGYGAVLISPQGRKELSGGYRKTTNNRMEITAAIAGLETLKGKCRVDVFSDSEYMVNAVEKGWARRWRATGWMRNAKDKAVNPDLWARLLSLCEAHDVRFIWVRGHAGTKENERCDRLATSAAARKSLPADVVYESQEGTPSPRSNNRPPRLLRP